MTDIQASRKYTLPFSWKDRNSAFKEESKKKVEFLSPAQKEFYFSVDFNGSLITLTLIFCQNGNRHGIKSELMITLGILASEMVYFSNILLF